MNKVVLVLASYYIRTVSKLVVILWYTSTLKSTLTGTKQTFWRPLYNFKRNIVYNTFIQEERHNNWTNI